MKKFKVHTLTELSIFTDLSNSESTVGSEVIKDALIFKYHIDNTSFVSLAISSTDSSDESALKANLRFRVEDIEHLHAWLGVLLRNKAEV